MAELAQDADPAVSTRPTPSPSVAPVCPDRATESVRFTPADRRMRAILRVGDQIDPSALLGAQSAMSKSILVSAIRCTITYLLIPILGSTIGLLSVFGAPLSISLCLFAGFMSIRSMRRFWIANHPRRWAYTAFASVVLVALAVGITFDVLRLLGR